MLIVKIQAEANGAHANQNIFGGITPPDGWAIVPETIPLPGTWPFVSLSAEGGVVVAMTGNDAAWESAQALGLEAVREQKLREISDACRSKIVAGVDMNGKHYSLDENDQRNIDNMFNAVVLGAESYPYHADGELCSSMPASDIITLYTSYQSLVTYETTYHNFLKRYVSILNTAEGINAVTYGMELPSVYLDQMNPILESARETTAAVIAKLTSV